MPFCFLSCIPFSHPPGPSWGLPTLIGLVSAGPQPQGLQIILRRCNFPFIPRPRCSGSFQKAPVWLYFHPPPHTLPLLQVPSSEPLNKMWPETPKQKSIGFSSQVNFLPFFWWCLIDRWVSLTRHQFYPENNAWEKCVGAIFNLNALAQQQRTLQTDIWNFFVQPMTITVDGLKRSADKDILLHFSWSILGLLSNKMHVTTSNRWGCFYLYILFGLLLIRDSENWVAPFSPLHFTGILFDQITMKNLADTWSKHFTQIFMPGLW